MPLVDCPDCQTKISVDRDTSGYTCPECGYEMQAATNETEAPQKSESKAVRVIGIIGVSLIINAGFKAMGREFSPYALLITFAVVFVAYYVWRKVFGKDK